MLGTDLPGARQIIGGGDIQTGGYFVGSTAIGTLSLSAGAVLELGGPLAVGSHAQGEAFIYGGSQVYSTGVGPLVAGVVGDFADGQITISGVGSNWTADGQIAVGGASATGAMTLLDHGSVNTKSLVVGYGGNGTVDVYSGSVVMVHDAGAGFLNVGGGGLGAVNLHTFAELNTDRAFIGGFASNESNPDTVSVDGANWSNAGDLTVGSGGYAELKITNSGIVQTQSLFIGSTGVGTVAVDGSGLQTDQLTIGGVHGELDAKSESEVVTGSAYVGSDGIGVVDVSGHSTWTNDGVLVVGDTGSGTVTVEGSSTLTTKDTYVGGQPAGVGSITVGSASDPADESSMIVDGNLTVGVQGSGALTVNGAASVSASSLYVGSESNGDGTGGTGTVIVAGEGAKLTLSGDLNMAGGDSTFAELDVANGGSVSGQDGYVGSGEGGTAVSTIDGTNGGALLNLEGTLSVGTAGNGTVTVIGGGTVQAVTAIIGDQESGVGWIALSGVDSELHTGDLIVGSYGNGTLTLDDGAIVKTEGSAVVGVQASGGGNVMLGSYGATENHPAWTVAGDLTVGNAGSGFVQIFDGTVTSDTATLGSQQDSYGNVTVTGTSSFTTNALVVGDAGQADLVIKELNHTAEFENAGVFSQDTIVANQEGSFGTVTVNGTDGNTLPDWTVTGALTIGNGGTGTVNLLDAVVSISGDMTVGGTTTGYGNLIVTNSAITVGGNTIVGEDGTGNVVVADGGVLTSSGGASIGHQQDGWGTVSVGVGAPDAHASWVITGDLKVGDAGTGFLTVSAGGSVTASSLDVGAQDGSNGTVTVDGVLVQGVNSYSLGASINLDSGAGPLTVGDSGTGTLDVKNGGEVDAGQVIVGNQANGVGTITIESSGVLNVQETLDVGKSGQGSVNVESGGQLSAQDLTIGDTTIGAGQVAIDASHVQIANDVIVGSAGIGYLDINNTGSLRTGGNAGIGEQAGGLGQVQLTGSGAGSADWQVTGSIYVGDLGRGALFLGPDSSVTAATVDAGVAAGSRGDVKVNGLSGSSDLNVGSGTGALTIGDAGNGHLTVSNGGTVEAGNLIIGNVDTGTGTVTIDSGGVLTLKGFVVVGGAGTGTLIVQNGSVGSGAFGALFVGAAGTGTLTITKNSNFTANGLTAGDQASSTATISIGGAPGGADSSHLSIVDDAVIGGAGAATLTVSGTGAALDVKGGLIVGDTGTGSVSAIAGGAVNAGSVIIAAQHGSTGSITVGSDSSMNVVGSLTVSTGGNGSMLVNGIVNAQGVFLAPVGISGNSAVVIVDQGTLNAGPTLVIGGAPKTGGGPSATLTLGHEGGGTGTVQADLIDVMNGGAITGDGSLLGNVQVDQGGLVSPGFSPGLIDITGNLVGNGEFDMQIAGYDPSQFDQIFATGSIQFTGQLDISFIDGFTPDPHEFANFLLFHSGDPADSFFDPSSISYFSLPSDYLSLASFNDGVLSFGTASSSVPEPGSVSVGFAGLCVVAFLGRRRRRVGAQD